MRLTFIVQEDIAEFGLQLGDVVGIDMDRRVARMARDLPSRASEDLLRRYVTRLTVVPDVPSPAMPIPSAPSRARRLRLER